MHWPEFNRACHYGRTSRDRWALYVVGIAAALLLPLLLLDLGLLTHLVLGNPQGVMPQDWVLAPWTTGAIADWPLFGDARTCLLTLVAFGVVVGMIEVWALWLLNRAVQRAALGVVLRLQADIHRQAYRIGVEDLLGDRRTAPERLMTDQLGELYCGLLRWWHAVPFAVVAFLSMILFAMAINVWLTLVVLLSLLLVRLVYRGAAQRAQVAARRWVQESTRRREQLMENIRLTPLATGYGLSDAPGVPFRELLGRFRQAELLANDPRAALGPTLLALIVWALACIVLVVGLSRYATVAGTVVLAAASLGAYFPAARLYRLVRSLGPADVAARELFAYLRREPRVRQIDGAQAIPAVRRTIKLDHVTLADTAGVKLLDRVSLSISAHSRAAILASDRTAGMALAGLFVRLYDPAAGRVTFDGFDIAKATVESVRRQTLLVPADGMLFEGTIHDNISCGDAGFTTLQVTDAAKQARANSFVMEFPKGFGTKIGGDGVQLTTSQAFRIALARALLRNPSVLIIVEPEQVEDDDSLALIDDALRLAAQDRTMIVLPAHLSSLQSAQEVIVLHEGQILDTGLHEHLLRTCELYRHLNYVRFHAFRHIR